VKGDTVGLEVYPATTPGTSAPDWTHLRLALQSAKMGEFQYELPGEADLVRPYGLGDSTVFADDASICRTSALEPAEVDVPERPTGDVDEMGNPVVLPAVHLRETWKNISTYVTNDFKGMTFAAEATMEDVIQGCTTTYTISALSPAVNWGIEIYDDMGNVVGYDPDDLLCNAEPDPEKGYVFGSGIDPRITTRCDPETFYCVPVGSPLDPL